MEEKVQVKLTYWFNVCGCGRIEFRWVWKFIDLTSHWRTQTNRTNRHNPANAKLSSKREPHIWNHARPAKCYMLYNIHYIIYSVLYNSSMLYVYLNLMHVNVRPKYHKQNGCLLICWLMPNVVPFRTQTRLHPEYPIDRAKWRTAIAPIWPFIWPKSDTPFIFSTPFSCGLFG